MDLQFRFLLGIRMIFRACPGGQAQPILMRLLTESWTGVGLEV